MRTTAPYAIALKKNNNKYWPSNWYIRGEIQCSLISDCCCSLVPCGWLITFPLIFQAAKFPNEAGEVETLERLHPINRTTMEIRILWMGFGVGPEHQHTHFIISRLKKVNWGKKTHTQSRSRFYTFFCRNFRTNKFAGNMTERKKNKLEMVYLHKIKCRRKIL